MNTFVPSSRQVATILLFYTLASCQALAILHPEYSPWPLSEEEGGSTDTSSAFLWFLVAASVESHLLTCHVLMSEVLGTETVPA